MDRPDKDVLEAMYFGKKMNCPQIASELGYKTGKVKYWIKKYGMELRSRGEAHKLIAAFVKHPKRKGGKARTECCVCGKELFRFPYRFKEAKSVFCGLKCKGLWQSENWAQENAPNWRGGEWSKQATTVMWTSYRTLRARIIEEQKVCAICGSDHVLTVHHISQRKDHPEKTFEADNLIVLCRACHIALHSKNKLIPEGLAMNEKAVNCWNNLLAYVSAQKRKQVNQQPSCEGNLAEGSETRERA